MSYILTDISKQIAVLTINRPDALNAINNEVIKDLSTAIKSCIDNNNVG
ncbi:MAG TPA: enoyl-CoA hydratase, partial [Candidatus Marinimicrobia bacterium]|nr:enoyl-CoA hydratase [Candidatus Neomarinimicrobiota bacterium]